MKFFEAIFNSSTVKKDNFDKIINEYYIVMIDTAFKNLFDCVYQKRIHNKSDDSITIELNHNFVDNMKCC